MPNLNARIGAGTAAICKNSHVSIDVYQQVKSLLASTSEVYEMEEKLFGVFTAIAGCSPAFTYLYIESLAKGAHKLGMDKEQALAIATKAVLGSAKAMQAAKEHPWGLIDKVCSPGGMTIEGICSLEEDGFGVAVVRAVGKAAERDLGVGKS